MGSPDVCNRLHRELTFCAFSTSLWSDRRGLRLDGCRRRNRAKRTPTFQQLRASALDLIDDSPPLRKLSVFPTRNLLAQYGPAAPEVVDHRAELFLLPRRRIESQTFCAERRMRDRGESLRNHGTHFTDRALDVVKHHLGPQAIFRKGIKVQQQGP